MNNLQNTHELINTNNGQAILSKFEGFLSLEEFSSIANTTLDLARQKSISDLVVDTRNIKAMKPELMEFLQSEWFPMASAIGIKKMAMIMPLSAIGGMSVKRANSETMGIQTSNHKSLVDAVEWIDSNKIQ